jgi:hypothetical protein
MAIAFVQTATLGATGSATSISTSAFSSNPTINNYIIVWTYCQGTGATDFTVSDSTNLNTYTPIGWSSISTQIAVQFFYTKVQHTGSSFTVTVTTSESAQPLSIVASEFSGIGSIATSAITETGNLAGSGTTAISPGNLNISSGDLVIAICGIWEQAGRVTIGTPASWTQVSLNDYTTDPMQAFLYGQSLYYINPSSPSDPNWSITNSDGSPFALSQVAFGNNSVVSGVGTANATSNASGVGASVNKGVGTANATATASGQYLLNCFFYARPDISTLITDGAASFTGSSSTALHSGSFGYSLTSSDFTVSCWIYNNGSASTNQGFLSIGDSGGSYTDSLLFLPVYSSAHYDIAIYFAGLSNGLAYTGSSTQAWVNYTVTWTKTSGAFTLYVNGVLQSTATNTGSGFSGTSVVMGNANGNYATGYLDSVGVWNENIGQTGATTLYNSGNGYIYANLPSSVGTSNGLQYWWDLGEQTGTARVDRVAGLSLADSGSNVALVAGIASGPAIYNGDPVTNYYDLSQNADNASQTTASERPQLQTGSNGVNNLNALLYNTTSAYLGLGSNITLSGTFTAWAVGTRANSSNFQPFGSIASNSSVTIYVNNNVYAGNVSNVYIDVAYTGDNGIIACRWRRDASNNVWFASSGMPEVNIGNLTGSIIFNSLGSNPSSGEYNGSTNLHAMQYVANTDLVTTNPYFVQDIQTMIYNTWGIGIPIAGIGTAPGTSTATANSQAIKQSVATAPGNSTANPIGASICKSTYTALGTSTANAIGVIKDQSIGSAPGTSQATGIGISISRSIGTAPGTSTANANSIAVKQSTFNATGEAFANAIGEYFIVEMCLSAELDIELRYTGNLSSQLRYTGNLNICN